MRLAPDQQEEDIKMLSENISFPFNSIKKISVKEEEK